MTRQDRLADGMLCAVIWICVLFFAFAAGVWYDEHNAEPAEEYTVGEPMMGLLVEKHKAIATFAPVEESGFTGPDPMCEDSFLLPDHPLSYELQTMLYGACLEFGVEFELALAVMEQETQFRNLMGDGGKAYGYFQVWPKWHKDRMEKLGVTDLMDPESNFRVACDFLSECINKYGLERGLGYYNSGEAKVTGYSREVMEKYGA